ncbi:MAG: alpha/beta hydrolase [Sandaracinaceae bacterium]|nr:alpha/beta hydrolase [Sandaracinaceae bacterium]
MSARTEGFAESNGVRLAYEEFGDPAAPALLMIAGMSLQRIAWPDALCSALAHAGYRVIRFDNRDVGASSWTAGPPPPTLGKRYLQGILGRELSIRVGPGEEAQYDLHTLALDAVGLLDALQIERAHFVGFSMGGMISQLVAADHAARVSSLTSIMSSPNERTLPKPTPRVLLNLLKPPPAMDPDSLALANAKMWEMIGSPAYPTPREELIAQTHRSLARGMSQTGLAHHLMAILATGGFGNRLHKVQAPALILHGDADPLVRVEGGRLSAQLIPKARLRVIRGMGHDFPAQLVPTLAGAITSHLQQTA